MSTTDSIDTYVDTCFLMNEAGRDYLRRLHDGKVKVIATVRAELEKHRERNEAKAGRALLVDEGEFFEFLRTLPEERDIQNSLSEHGKLQADSVFRRLAIRYEAEGRRVCFLTADMALAEALSVYHPVILYLSRHDECVGDWYAYREQRRQKALEDLRETLCKKDVVLTSSSLKSPYLCRFLQNVQSLSLAPEHLPILHPISLEPCAHLKRSELSMLEDSRIVRRCGGLVKYPTETALLDAFYYARCAGRDICMLVGGWDEIEARYDARSRAAEMAADNVEFCILLPWGELSPLLPHVRLRLWADKMQEDGDAPDSSQAEDLSAADVRDVSQSVQEQETVSSDVSGNTPGKPIPVEVPDSSPIEVVPPVALKLSAVGSQLTTLLKAGKIEAVRSLIGDIPERLELALLYARRWGQRALLAELMERVEKLQPDCLNKWFKEAKTSTYRLTKEELLEDDEYYQHLLAVVDKTENPAAAQAALASLLHIARHGSVRPAQRAKTVLMKLRERGVAIAQKDVAPQNLPQLPNFNAVEKRYQSRLVTTVRETKAADLVAVLREMSSEVEFPALRMLAIKVARRQARPGAITALLNDMESLPSYCFKNWFTRSKSYEKSPRARDLLERKSYYDLTTRIIRKSPDLKDCQASMQALLTLSKDSDETIRSRAEKLMALAVEKGAPAVGKK